MQLPGWIDPLRMLVISHVYRYHLLNQR
jgi:hypothetical protein